MGRRAGYGSPQNGMALITVLLVVALITTLAVEISTAVSLDIRKSSNQHQGEQAYWFALSGENYAAKVLRQDHQGSEHSHLGQDWARGEILFPIDGGTLAGEIEDQRSCFNLNALAPPPAPEGEPPESDPNNPEPSAEQKQFQALLDALGVESPAAATLRDTLIDWLDADFQPSGFEGAEDLFYSNRQPPYVTANAPLAALSELKLLASYDPELIHVLAEYLCLLPREAGQSLNINTLDRDKPALLSAAFEGQMSLAQAEELLNDRPERGWTTLEEFWIHPLITTLQPKAELKDRLRVRSDYYQARIRVQYHSAYFQLTSGLRMEGAKVQSYRRHYGGIH